MTTTEPAAGAAVVVNDVDAEAAGDAVEATACDGRDAVAALVSRWQRH